MDINFQLFKGTQNRNDMNPRITDFTIEEIVTLSRVLAHIKNVMDDGGLPDDYFNRDHIDQWHTKVIEAKIATEDKEKVNLN